LGQLVTGETAQQRKALWIPSSAHIDLGDKEIAFVKDEGVFKPKLIVTTKTTGKQT